MTLDVDEKDDNKYGIYLKCFGISTVTHEGIMEMLGNTHPLTFTEMQYHNVAYGFFSRDVTDENTLPNNMLDRPSEEVIVEDDIFSQVLAAVTADETNFVYITQPLIF